MPDISDDVSGEVSEKKGGGPSGFAEKDVFEPEGAEGENAPAYKIPPETIRKAREDLRKSR